ncbi:unnamed protein product [Closterium sp. Yama58-4]|nr:unnamed protein product [Closterium sp. Yama58-4]
MRCRANLGRWVEGARGSEKDGETFLCIAICSRLKAPVIRGAQGSDSRPRLRDTPSTAGSEVIVWRGNGAAIGLHASLPPSPAMDATSRPPAAPLSARRWVVAHKKWAPPAAARPPASASFASSLADSFLPSHGPSHPSHVPSHPSLVSSQPSHASHQSHGGSWANGSVVDGSCGLEASQRGRAEEGWSGARNSGARHDGDAAVPGGTQADAGWRKRKSHLSAATADDSACLTSSHGPRAAASALPHVAVAPSHAVSPFAHLSGPPPTHATRWDVPLFSAKRACLAAAPHRPAEGAAWAERPGAWGEGPAAFKPQCREAAAAAAAVAGKAEGRGDAWRALSASSVDFAPQPFQQITESDLLLEASGSGAPLAFAVGAAAGAHGDGRGGLHHPASSARSVGASMESGARTRRVVCARGRKRRGAGGDPGQQVAMARRAGDGSALIEAGGWTAAQDDAGQCSCAYGGEKADAEDGQRAEEEAERREGGGVGAESIARPRRRRRKVGLVGLAEEGETAEERDGVAAATELSSLCGASPAAGAAAALGSTMRRPSPAHAPVLAGCGAAAGGTAGSASVEGARPADGAVSANTCAPSSAECRAPEGSSGDSSACERESTGSEQRAGRRRNARVLQETVNGARGEGLRDDDGEARCCADDRGNTRQRQRQRQRQRPNQTGGVVAGGAGEEADEEAEMRRRFSVVVQSQVAGGEEEDGPLEGDANRSMSEHVGAAKFVLSSGRTLSAEGLPAPKKKPTIDDEFEQYFAQLLL